MNSIGKRKRGFGHHLNDLHNLEILDLVKQLSPLQSGPQLEINTVIDDALNNNEPLTTNDSVSLDLEDEEMYGAQSNVKEKLMIAEMLYHLADLEIKIASFTSNYVISGENSSS